MLTYTYTATNPKTGDQIKAQVEAEDEKTAADLIRKEGLTPLKIKPITSSGSFGKLFSHVSTKDKVLFSRQLATLLNAGLPLVQALRNVGSQTQSKPLQLVISNIVSSVEGGVAFSAALAKHRDVFNDVFINLVAAGETSGTLDKALERLAIQQEKDADIISKVRGALAYPIVVVFVMIAVIGFMIVKVLPAVGSIYKSLPGVQLPFLTRVLLELSQFIIHRWLIVVIILIVLALFTTRWARTLGGKRVVDRVKMKMWPFGPLFMKVYMARFARTASTLVASGVPLIQVLEVTAKAVNNIHIQDSLKRSIDGVKGGKALSETLKHDRNFLELVPNMIKIGEESGTIDKMLEKIADYYETEVDNEIKTISTLMEPVLMVILGIVAFIIVAAVLLPIYGLAGNSTFTSQI